MTATLTAVTDTHATIAGQRYAFPPAMRWFLERHIGREIEIVVVSGAIKHAAIPSASVSRPE